MNLDNFRQNIKDQFESYKYNYLGKKAITAVEKAEFERLIRKGLIKKNRMDFFAMLFSLGKASVLYGDDKVKVWVKTQLINFMESEAGKLSNIEESALSFIKAEGEGYLDVLFSNIGSRINGQFRDRILGGPEFTGQVQEALTRRIVNRQTARAMAQDIGRHTGAWSKDLYRIAFSESTNSYNMGLALSWIKASKKPANEIMVARIPRGEGISCDECMKLYWDKGKNQPKIYKLSELMGNSNFGRKRKEWLPTLISTHPFDGCSVIRVYPGQHWNSKYRRFQYSGDK